MRNHKSTASDWIICIFHWNKTLRISKFRKNLKWHRLIIDLISTQDCLKSLFYFDSSIHQGPGDNTGWSVSWKCICFTDSVFVEGAPSQFRFRQTIGFHYRQQETAPTCQRPAGPPVSGLIGRMNHTDIFDSMETTISRYSKVCHDCYRTPVAGKLQTPDRFSEPNKTRRPWSC